MKYRLLLLSLLFSLYGFSQNLTLMVGTYTGSGSKGIYVYKFDAATGKTENLNASENLVNPSYLALSADKKFIYAVNETGGNTPGTVSALSFNQSTGDIKLINQVPTGGDHPCYISVTGDNTLAAVGNYSGGNLSVFPINNDGSLQPFAQLIQNEGSSVVKQRQDKPHVHAAVLSPDGKYLFSPDLGTDKVMIYKLNKNADKPLTPANPPYVSVEGGSGPRHLTFHPNNKYAYLIEELSGTVSAFKYKKGKLTFIQKIAAHPSDFKGVIGSADIHVSPDGKFLYASNRGEENTIAIFSIDKKGKLASIGFQSTMGKTPRNFTIDPTGKFLLVANQETDNIVIFKRDVATGLLEYTGSQIEVPKPVFLKIF